MGKTSRRGEVEDREAEEEDSGSRAHGKMGQISALSFIIIPETISSFSSSFFSQSFTLKFFFLTLLMIVKLFSVSSHPKPKLKWPEVLKSSYGLSFFECVPSLSVRKAPKSLTRNT